MKNWESKANWKDPKWKYTHSSQTDITKTIARVKREMKALEEEAEEQKPKQVVQLKKVAK